jgi:hypothetical protein
MKAIITAAILALVAVAPAAARLDPGTGGPAVLVEGVSPDDRAIARSEPPSMAPDDRAFARSETISPGTPKVVVVDSDDSGGFVWGDAAQGAAVGFALAALLAAALLFVRSRRAHARSPEEAVPAL